MKKLVISTLAGALVVFGSTGFATPDDQSVAGGVEKMVNAPFQGSVGIFNALKMSGATSMEGMFQSGAGSLDASKIASMHAEAFFVQAAKVSGEIFVAGVKKVGHSVHITYHVVVNAANDTVDFASTYGAIAVDHLKGGSQTVYEFTVKTTDQALAAAGVAWNSIKVHTPVLVNALIVRPIFNGTQYVVDSVTLTAQTAKSLAIDAADAINDGGAKVLGYSLSIVGKAANASGKGSTAMANASYNVGNVLTKEGQRYLATNTKY